MFKGVISTSLVATLLALLMTSCYSIDGDSQDSQSTAVGKDGKPTAEAAKSTDSKETLMTEEELLTVLSPDANGPVTMDSNPNAVASGVALSDKLESVPQARNAVIGAADPYASVHESEVSSSAPSLLDDFEDVAQDPASVASGEAGATVSAGEAALSSAAVANATAGSAALNQQNTPIYSVKEVGHYQKDGACSLALHSEASGLARALVKELAARLRNEYGSIYVAQSIIDRDYQDCIQDLSTALQEGLYGSKSFQLVAGTNSLRNVVSQNIGSATILPNLIYHCRASKIPYLVISQVRKTGDKAALTIRIIRTEDGITLAQTYRRLSQ